MRIRARRLLAVLGTLAIAFTIFAGAATPVSAHALGSSHTYDQCITTNTDGIIIARHSATGTAPPGIWYNGVGRVTGGRGILTARALHPCTYESVGDDSKSMVLPVNLQGTDDAGNFEFVQIGVGKFHHPGMSGCGGWQHDQTTFIYTPDPNSGGVVCKATFFDPDNNGVANDPIGGHDYEFKIEQSDLGGNFWRFWIDDLDDTYAGDYVLVNRESHDSGLADSGGNPVWWAGCEVGSYENAIGVSNGEPGLVLREMAYKKASDNLFHYTEDSTAYNGWGTFIPTYYKAGQSQTGLGEQLNCYTVYHT